MSNRLYKTGESGDDWEFELENYKFWDIRYDTQTEEWTITKEDGSQQIYGGQVTDSDQSPLQYGVRWVRPNSNWIGSSTDSDGQQQFVLAWNLTQIQNTWGDSITCGYENSLENIGSTDGEQYTRDSRLKTITDPFGKTITFNYSDKTNTNQIHEFQIPHIDSSSSNFIAYQDRYGTEFLQSISVTNPTVSEQASSDLLFTVEFGYDLVNATLYNPNDPNFYKRYLTSVTQVTPDGRVLPGMKFSYYNTDDLDDQTHRGALKTITYPKGGVGTYTYDKVILSATDRSLNISVTGTPRVWFGGDYTVVTQYDDSDGSLAIQIYSWNGNWMEDPSSTTLSFKLDIESLQVAVQSDFFALSFKTTDAKPTMRVYLFHKEKGEYGNWQYDFDTLTVDSDGEQALLASGSSFVVACASDGDMMCKVWDVPSDSWMDRSNDFSIDAGGKYALAAFNNYFALSTYDSSDESCSLDIYTILTYRCTYFISSEWNPISIRLLMVDQKIVVFLATNGITYQARTEDVYDTITDVLDFDDWNNDNQPSSDDWIKISENVSFAEAGVVLETLDVDDVSSAVLLDASSELTVAEFVNASQTAVTYIGFESYEQTQGWQMSGGSQTWDECIISGDAHTGTQSLQLLPDPDAVLEDTLTISNTGQVYILSCWMKTPSDFSGDSGAADWVINVDGDNVATFSIDGTNGDWQYRNYVVDLSQYASGTSVTVQAYNHKTSSDLYLLFDDIFFAPLVGGAVATVYDPTFKIPTASVDFTGKTNRGVYDTFLRPVAQIGPCENVNAVGMPYLTRQNNDADPVLPQDAPNSTLTINAMAGGNLADLVNGAEWVNDWSSENMDKWTVENSLLVHTQASADSITFTPTQDFVDYGARVSVFLLLDDQGVPIEPQNPIGMSIGTLSAQWTPDAGWTVTSPDGTVTVSDDADIAFNTDWLLVAGSDTLLFYADGRQIFAQHTTQAISGTLELSVEDTDISFANIVVFKTPQLGIIYTDGANQERQTQALNGTDCLIAATCYDDLGRANIAPKTAQFSDTVFGYDQQFVQSIAADTGVMTGEVADYCPDDAGYPYSRTVFEASPLSRTIQQGLPGQDFAITGSNSHVAAFAYGTNVEGAFGGDTCPSNQYYVQQTTDANGVPTYVLTNQLGQTVATKTGPIDTDGDVYKIAQYHYDSSGNLLRVLMPNCFAPPSGADSNDDAWVITRTYDFLGQVTEHTTPDSGTTQYIYDLAGRPRFMMDAQGADPSQSENTISYNKYDALGRLIEDGFFEGEWGDGSTLQDKADNDPNWPDDTQPHTWRHQYTFDGDGTDPNAIGMLASTSNSNANSIQDIEEVYAYDGYRDTISRSITAGGYDTTTRTVGYT